MKKTYEAPQLEMIPVSDVIVTSGDGGSTSAAP
jgi:UDP:flavonoid glycosyltransferase YjiC (YdhE family)